MNNKKYNVAVVGATGAVGEEIFQVLQETNFPIAKLIPIASKRSLGKKIQFNNKDIAIEILTHDIFTSHNIDIAFFSAGADISKEFVSSATNANSIVIDNTSYFRMHKDVPLVVPEVNSSDITLCKQKGIIANPNCSTIQMVEVLKPLDDAFDLLRVDVSTYQATSGSGNLAMKELANQMKDFFNFKLMHSKHKCFPHQIALNVIPQIDIFTDNGFTKEEMKMVNETRKILHKEVEVAATCVRVPTFRGHAESLKLTFDSTISANEAKRLLSQTKNILLLDDITKNEYPMPTTCVGKDETFVGRIREDLYQKNILHLWIVADNLRVGAATNSVRIALKWIELKG